MKYTRSFSLATLLWLLVLPLAAQTPAGTWEQVDDDDGIKVWQLVIPGRELPGFRGETVIPGPAELIVEELKKVDQHTQWMHRCTASNVIRNIDEDRVIIYNRTDTPWPVWDRDAILDTQFTRSADKKEITLTFKNTDPSLRPVPESVIRMPRLVGSYRMTKLADDKTRVVYQVEVDIGGSVPTFIAKRVARDMPYETLSRLRERVKNVATAAR
jgi:hypothetical protein